MKTKTIKGKLLTCTLSIIAGSLLIVGIVASLINYNSTVNSLKQTMVEAVKLAALSVTHEMEGYERLAAELAYNPVLTSEESAKKELESECAALAERNGLQTVGIADINGISVLSGNSVMERDYFNIPKQTLKCYVSDPIIRKDTGEMSIFISAPIMKNNKFNGIVYLGIDASVLCETVKGIQVGKTGNASMINSAGDTIGYADVQLVLDAYNTQNELANDKQLEQLAAIERRVMDGEANFDTYIYGGVHKYAAFTPVEGTPGWGIYIAVEQSEFLQGTYLGIILIVFVAVLFIILGIIIIMKFAASLSKPITLCVDRIRLLAKGDTHSEMPKISTGDEIQILAESMQVLMINMKCVIGDIDYCLSEMAQGNFKFESKEQDSYVGDFSNIIDSIHKLKKTLTEVIISIIDSADQVSCGADQLSTNAQGLAEGAQEQASAVEELTATITEITENARVSALTAKEACENVRNVMKEAEERNNEMKKLNQAMEDIKNTSKGIENIISAIEDIANQTNLLSLNASIEASRAGDAGRGFAVVAEQIGKLASDSAESAVETKKLIQKSLLEVEHGDKIAIKGVNAFQEVIREMQSFAKVINDVSESSQTQATSLKEVEQGVEQISSVVQNNSASSEDASATSQELSAQAETLNTLVRNFNC